MKEELEKAKLDYDFFVDDSEHYEHIEKELDRRITFQYAELTAYGRTESFEKAKNGDLREVFILLNFLLDEDFEMLCEKLPNEFSNKLRIAKKSLEDMYDEYESPREHYHCRDCSIDTRDLPVYMLKDEVWLTIANKDDILCFQCAEKRLDRKIKPEDFINRWWGKEIIEEWGL